MSDSKDDPTELDLTQPSPQQPAAMRVPSPQEIQRAVDAVETLAPPPGAPPKPFDRSKTQPIEPPRLFNPDPRAKTLPDFDPLKAGFTSEPSRDPTMREQAPPPPPPAAAPQTQLVLILAVALGVAVLAIIYLLANR